MFKELNGKYAVVVCLFIFIFIIACGEDGTGPEVDFTDLTGEYLGQQRPGMEPVRFPPDILLANNLWFYHGSPVFSPDGQEMFWVKYYQDDSGVEIYFMKKENNRWTTPQPAPFANTEYIENNPIFSVDGNKIFFVSSRPGGRFFSVNRTQSGWSSPTPLNITIPSSYGTGWQVSVIRDESIYFELWSNNTPDIYRSRLVDGQYTQPENLGATINSEYNDFSPFVNPDENYIIYVSNRPGGYGMHDLYISFKNANGSWTEPRNMGNSINTGFEDAAPYVTPDGSYFFFTTQKAGDQGYNPYWVDAQIIEDLKPEELK